VPGPTGGEPHPAGLGRGDVLDEPADGQGADRGAPRGLVVGQPPRGVPQEATVPAQRLDQVGALAGHDAVGHAGSLGRPTDTFGTAVSRWII
jgi:hypothetical protein